MAERQLAGPPGEDRERKRDHRKQLDAPVEEGAAFGDEQRSRGRDNQRDTGTDEPDTAPDRVVMRRVSETGEPPRRSFFAARANLEAARPHEQRNEEDREDDDLDAGGGRLVERDDGWDD